jgi:hypothetical protein
MAGFFQGTNAYSFKQSLDSSVQTPFMVVVTRAMRYELIFQSATHVLEFSDG